MLPPQQNTTSIISPNAPIGPLAPNTTHHVSKQDLIDTYKQTVADMHLIKKIMKNIVDKVDDNTSDFMMNEVLTLLQDNDIKRNLEIMQQYEQVVNKLFS